MTIASVVAEVCAFVGVRPPVGNLFVPPETDRTSWEFVSLANEMGQRIAYDTREWQKLRAREKYIGDGLASSFNLRADFQRMLKTAQVWRSRDTSAPMAFISDPDEWLRKEMQGYISPRGEWTIEGGQMVIRPVLAAGETATYYYLRNTCVSLRSGGFGNRFVDNLDEFVLPERLLKLGMLWQWKAYKGATYAEDLSNYTDALDSIAGADKPSPIIVGSQPISSDANIAYYGPVPPPGTFVGPGP